MTRHNRVFYVCDKNKQCILQPITHRQLMTVVKFVVVAFQPHMYGHRRPVAEDRPKFQSFGFQFDRNRVVGLGFHEVVNSGDGAAQCDSQEREHSDHRRHKPWIATHLITETSEPHRSIKFTQMTDIVAHVARVPLNGSRAIELIPRNSLPFVLLLCCLVCACRYEMCMCMCARHTCYSTCPSAHNSARTYEPALHLQLVRNEWHDQHLHHIAHVQLLRWMAAQPPSQDKFGREPRPTSKHRSLNNKLQSNS